MEYCDLLADKHIYPANLKPGLKVDGFHIKSGDIVLLAGQQKNIGAGLYLVTDNGGIYRSLKSGNIYNTKFFVNNGAVYADTFYEFTETNSNVTNITNNGNPNIIVADGKTVTFNNTLTFIGTDAATIKFPNVDLSYTVVCVNSSGVITLPLGSINVNGNFNYRAIIANTEPPLGISTDSFELLNNISVKKTSVGGAIMSTELFLNSNTLYFGNNVRFTLVGSTYITISGNGSLNLQGSLTISGNGLINASLGDESHQKVAFVSNSGNVLKLNTGLFTFPATNDTVITSNAAQDLYNKTFTSSILIRGLVNIGTSTDAINNAYLTNIICNTAKTINTTFTFYDNADAAVYEFNSASYTIYRDLVMHYNNILNVNIIECLSIKFLTELSITNSSGVHIIRVNNTNINIFKQINMNSQRISGLAYPILSQDAVTLGYLTANNYLKPLPDGTVIIYSVSVKFSSSFEYIRNSIVESTWHGNNLSNTVSYDIFTLSNNIKFARSYVGSVPIYDRMYVNGSYIEFQSTSSWLSVSGSVVLQNIAGSSDAGNILSLGGQDVIFSGGYEFGGGPVNNFFVDFSNAIISDKLAFTGSTGNVLALSGGRFAFPSIATSGEVVVTTLAQQDLYNKNFGSNILPTSNGTLNIGSSSLVFNSVYANAVNVTTLYSSTLSIMHTPSNYTICSFSNNLINFNKPLLMNFQKITRLADPIGDTDAVNLGYLSVNYATISSLSNYVLVSSLTAYLQKSGGTMSGTLNMNSNYITNIPNPVNAGDAVNLGYLSANYALISSLSNYALISSLSIYATTSSLSAYLQKSGGTMSGTLNMNSNYITNIATAINDYDAVNIKYLANNYYLKSSIVGAVTLGNSANIQFSHNFIYSKYVLSENLWHTIPTPSTVTYSKFEIGNNVLFSISNENSTNNVLYHRMYLDNSYLEFRYTNSWLSVIGAVTLKNTEAINDVGNTIIINGANVEFSSGFLFTGAPTSNFIVSFSNAIGGDKVAFSSASGNTLALSGGRFAFPSTTTSGEVVVTTKASQDLYNKNFGSDILPNSNGVLNIGSSSLAFSNVYASIANIAIIKSGALEIRDLTTNNTISQFTNIVIDFGRELNMNANKITGLVNPTLASDAVNLNYLSSNYATVSSLSQYLLKSGGTMTGNINMNNRYITNVANPVNTGDAVNFGTLSNYLVPNVVNKVLLPNSSSFKITGDFEYSFSSTTSNTFHIMSVNQDIYQDIFTMYNSVTFSKSVLQGTSSLVYNKIAINGSYIEFVNTDSWLSVNGFVYLENMVNSNGNRIKLNGYDVQFDNGYIFTNAPSANFFVDFSNAIGGDKLAFSSASGNTLALSGGRFAFPFTTTSGEVVVTTNAIQNLYNKTFATHILPLYVSSDVNAVNLGSQGFGFNHFYIRSIHASTAAGLTFYTSNATNIMFMDNNGVNIVYGDLMINVGSNIKAHTIKSIGSANDYLNFTNNSGTTKMLLNYANDRLDCSLADSYFLNLWVNDVQITSDARKKTNVIPIGDAMSVNLIENLAPVQYNMRDSTDIKHYGFIAQDVQPLIDGIVGNNGEYLSIAYNEFIPHIVNYLQHTKKIMNTQQIIINELIKRIELLENSNTVK